MSETTLPDPEPPGEPTDPGQLAPIREGRYVEYERVGKGGMGIVYLALDTDLNRRVAMKVVRPDLDPTASLPESPSRLRSPLSGSPVSDAFSELKARFLREARVTGAMEHPGIVPVYELGETTEGVPYYTMRFVRGNRTLRAALVGRPSFARRVVLLEPWLKVVDTLAYAHDRGVIHRDLKPANIALGDYGEVIVLDWGLAKVRDTPDEAAAEWKAEFSSDRPMHETVAGAIGTPGFMSPEAARGELERIDHRTDVYSLGVMLFEILSGRLPHDLTNLGTYMTSLLNHDPPRADELDEDVPEALADICALALARDPEDRIQSAIELAARVRFWEQSTQLARDVAQRFAQAEAALAAAEGLQGAAVLPPLDRAMAALSRAREVMPEDPRVPKIEQQIEAVRARALDERDRFARRRLLRRVALFGLGAVTIAAIVVGALLDAGRREALRERTRADDAALVARAANDKSQRSLGDSYAVSAGRFLQERRGAAAALAATRALELNPSIEAWLALGNALKILPPHSTPLSVGTAARCLAFDEDGDRLAAGGEYGRIRIWDMRTGRTTQELPVHGGATTRLAFFQDGEALVAAGEDGTLRVFDIAREQVTQTFVGPQDPIRGLAVLPQGTGFLAVTQGGRVLLWSRASGSIKMTLLLRSGPLDDVVLTADGAAWIRSASGQLLRVAPEQEARAAPETVMESGAAHIARWDEGRAVLVATEDRRLLRVESTGRTPTEAATLKPHVAADAGILALAGRPDSACVVLDDGTAVVIFADGREPSVLGGAGRRTRAAALAPDARYVATTDADQRIRLWMANRRAPVATQDGHSMSITGIATGGRAVGLVSAAQDGTLILWANDPLEPSTPVRVEQPGLGIRCLAVAPSGARAFCISMRPAPETGTRLHGIDLKTRSILWTREIDAIVLTNGLLACTEDHVFTLQGDGRIAVHVSETGEPVEAVGAGPEGGLGATNAFTLTPDRKRLVRAFYHSVDRRYVLRVVDLASGKETELPEHAKAMATCVAASPNGRFAAMGCADGTIGIWNLERGAFVRWIESRADRIFALAFSPDGEHLLSGGTGIRVFDVERGVLLQRWDGHAAAVSALVFDDAGERLFSSGFDGSVRVWRLDERGPVTRLTAGADCCTVHLDGSGERLFVGLADGTVEVRRPGTGEVQARIELPFDAPLQAYEQGVTHIALARDAPLVAIADGRMRVHVYDLQKKAFEGKPRPVRRPVTGLAISHEGEWVFVASGLQVGDGMAPELVEAERTREVFVYDVRGDTQPIEKLGGHGSRVTALALLDDGRVVYGVADGQIYVRVPMDPSRIQVLAGHARAVTHLYHVPGTSVLISTAKGDTMLTWDLGSARSTGRYKGSGPIVSDRDGSWLARVEPTQALDFYSEEFVRVWAPRANAEGFILPAHVSGLGGVALARDGTRVWTIGRRKPNVANREVDVYDLAWWHRTASERSALISHHTGLRLKKFEAQPVPSSHFTALVPDVFER